MTYTKLYFTNVLYICGLKVKRSPDRPDTYDVQDTTGSAARPAAAPGPLPRPVPAGDRLVVVFAEESRLPKLRCLKPGFRHCFAYLPLPQGWVGIDSLSHRIEIRGFPDWSPEADLAAHLRRLGQCALTVPVLRPPRRLAPPLPFSCVEMVKRMVGLQSWAIRTPWELFLELRKICLDASLSSFYNRLRTEQKINEKLLAPPDAAPR